MNQLAGYVERHGDEATADTLSALLGRKISTQSIRLWKTRPKPPKAWAEALGLGDSPLPHAEAETSLGPTDRGGPDSQELPPTPPPGQLYEFPVKVPEPATAAAERNIALFYGLLASAVSARTGNPGYRVATDKQAPEIAKAWIAAAEENEFARRIVALAGSGGATGQLVTCHVIWAATMLYIAGRVPNIGGFFSAYESYRTERPVPEPDEEPFVVANADAYFGAGVNGSPDTGAAHPVGDDQAAPQG